jgi:hypothetical protein
MALPFIKIREGGRNAGIARFPRDSLEIGPRLKEGMRFQYGVDDTIPDYNLGLTRR